jgi:fimbrial chaperone protein
MTAFIRMVALLIVATALPVATASATSLQAMPVLIEMPNGVGTSSVTVRNVGRAVFDVQTRIYRWKQVGGEDVLEETDDVATSPPIATLKPGSTYAVRIVRLDGKPVEREESFRVLVDQLPDEDKLRDGVVALVMRHSIPVFVAPESSGQPRLSWSVGTKNGRLVLRASNEGGRRVRLSEVSVTFENGKTVTFGKGLLGYVLSGSQMEWSAAAGSAASLGSIAKITATTDLGPLNVSAKVQR